MKEPKKTSYKEFEFTDAENLFQKMVEDYIERETYMRKDADGYYHQQMYADYRDELDDRTILEICQEPDCIDKFVEVISESWDYGVWQETDELVKNVCRYHDGFEFPEGMDEAEFEEWARSYVEENVMFDIPYDHYLDHKVDVNIFMDTGDGNYDFVLNTRAPAWGGESGRIPYEAGIAWLARTQGYTRGQLRAALNADRYNAIPKGFLMSMRHEMENVASHMNTVAFLVKMTVRELLNLNVLIRQQERDLKKGERHYDARKNPYCGYITLGKDTMTGLYDPWNGGGSVLEVELEKDVKVPIKYIWEALPDVKHDCKYPVGEVYGMSSRAWGETLKGIFAPKYLTSARQI